MKHVHVNDWQINKLRKHEVLLANIPYNEPYQDQEIVMVNGRYKCNILVVSYIDNLIPKMHNTQKIFVELSRI